MSNPYDPSIWVTPHKLNKPLVQWCKMASSLLPPHSQNQGLYNIPLPKGWSDGTADLRGEADIRPIVTGGRDPSFAAYLRS